MWRTWLLYFRCMSLCEYRGQKKYWYSKFTRTGDVNGEEKGYRLENMIKLNEKSNIFDHGFTVSYDRMSSNYQYYCSLSFLSGFRRVLEQKMAFGREIK